ncbi:MAG TPA: tRNA (adenosine(37)-N6)-threonylcarbamoyltransferase complex ATPase subunit type 1 TsaE [Nitrospiria bacterium]|nr:tRNA (adenosine(37)-N6)-threonylcarbamoyltransferase complex ATPase subunit type 1 TsaE [Nitrospiria bacterium]
MIMTSTARETFSRITRSPEETRRVGESIGRELSGGEVLALSGELGAGKTTLVQGIAKGLGVRTPYVASPTFILVSTHFGRVVLHHVDLYRLDGEAQAEEMGLLDYFSNDAVAVIEWADRALSLLPAERLTVTLKMLSEEEREITLSAEGAHYVAMTRRIKTP